jgi:hypothetical protein
MLAPELPSSSNSNSTSNINNNNNNNLYQMKRHGSQLSERRRTSSADDDQQDQDQQQQQTTDTILISLVHAYDWAGTLSHRSHPMRTLHPVRKAALHSTACENDAPAVVIQSISRVPKASLLMAGCAGMVMSTMNPLHITCSSRTASVASYSFGERSRPSVYRVTKTVIHRCTRRCRCGAPWKYWKYCYESAVPLFERDYEELTPVQRLWVRYFVIWARM